MGRSLTDAERVAKLAWVKVELANVQEALSRLTADDHRRGELIKHRDRLFAARWRLSNPDQARQVGRACRQRNRFRRLPGYSRDVEIARVEAEVVEAERAIDECVCRAEPDSQRQATLARRLHTLRLQLAHLRRTVEKQASSPSALVEEVLASTPPRPATSITVEAERPASSPLSPPPPQRCRHCGGRAYYREEDEGVCWACGWRFALVA